MAVTVTAAQAAELIGVSRVTIWSYVTDGKLAAERIGIRRDISIRLSDLRAFAAKYNYPFDEELARQYEA